MPTVTHVVPALFAKGDGVVGGAERYAYELARHMSAQVPTSLVTFGERSREERHDDLRVRVIGGAWRVRGQHNNPFSFALLGEARRAGVLHCHQQHIVASTATAIAARLTGGRAFCTDLGGGGWDLSAYVSTDRLFRGHLHVSGYSRHIAGHDQLASAHVIGGGVDAQKFSPDPAVPRSGRILFVGRVLPHKGVDVIIQALPVGMALDIVGHVRDERYLQDLQRLATGKSVAFHHDLGDAALVRMYRSALCVVLPSVYDDMYGGHTDVPELLGQTLLEGMACGTPAVGTQVASIPEIIEDGVTGFLVPPNDPALLGRALTCLASNSLRSRQFGDAARCAVVERFSWPAVVSRCLAIYAA